MNDREKMEGRNIYIIRWNIKKKVERIKHNYFIEKE